MITKEFQKMLENCLNKVNWYWVKLYIILSNQDKIKLLVYIKKIKNLSIFQWEISITWVMKDLSGLVILHRKWKSFLIQVLPGLGYFLRNANLARVLLEIKNLNTINHQNFIKTWKVDNSSHMEKVQSSATQRLTKYALLKTTVTACIIFHSWVLSKEKILNLYKDQDSWDWPQQLQNKVSLTSRWQTVFRGS